MRIAVLMSTYNGEKYLKEQIDSILRQTIDIDCELIVRDDGSTDDTINILNSYSQKNLLTYTVEENIGAARSFISLLRNNRGFDFYAFSDQDDAWNPDKLQKGISAIENLKGPALYCTNCELVSSRLESMGRNTHRKHPTYNLVSILCLASCAQGCTAVFNEDLAAFVQNNPIPDKFIMHDSLLTCLCGLIDGTIVYDENPSMKYRMHGDNVFGMVTAKQSIAGVIHSRIEEITKPKRISMYEQTESLMKTYGHVINCKNLKLCKTVIDAKYSLQARLKLILNRNLKHDTLNKTLTKKLEILLGND